MSELIMTGTKSRKIIEDALRFYWRILLGHVDDLENLYRLGVVKCRHRPDPERLSVAIDTIKQELFGLKPGGSYTLDDPRAPLDARLAFSIMKLLQDKIATKDHRPLLVPKMSRMDALKDRILALRTINKMTRSDFGFEIGCDKDTVKGWETGRYQPAEKYRDIMMSTFSLPKDFFDADNKGMPKPPLPPSKRSRTAEPARQEEPLIAIEHETKKESVKPSPHVTTTEKSKKAGGKLMRALSIIGVSGLPGHALEVINALREASNMVGNETSRMVFSEYCLDGVSGATMEKRHGLTPDRLSVLLARQAKAIRKNPRAISLIRDLTAPPKGLGSDLGKFLIGAGFREDEARKTIEVLAAFNIYTVSELRQVAQDGDLDAIPGITDAGVMRIKATA